MTALTKPVRRETPLAPKPYRLERDAWTMMNGEPEYVGFEEEHQFGRYETFGEACSWAARLTHCKVNILEMHVGVHGGEFGSTIASFSDGRPGFIAKGYRS